MEVLLLQVQKLVPTPLVRELVLPLLAELVEQRRLWLELELFALHSLPVFSSAFPYEHPLA